MEGEKEASSWEAGERENNGGKRARLKKKKKKNFHFTAFKNIVLPLSCFENEARKRFICIFRILQMKRKQTGENEYNWQKEERKQRGKETMENGWEQIFN